jgi:hypothetical protein
VAKVLQVNCKNTLNPVAGESRPCSGLSDNDDPRLSDKARYMQMWERKDGGKDAYLAHLSAKDVGGARQQLGRMAASQNKLLYGRLGLLKRSALPPVVRLRITKRAFSHQCTPSAAPPRLCS